jgi:replicative DNA helicase
MSKKLKGQELIEAEDKLSNYQGNDKVVSSHELALELKDTKESVFNIKTGINSLDRILDGTEAGELIVVTGPTGEGKTTLLMTITQNLQKMKIPSLWFTLEVTPRQFIKKISKDSGMDMPLFYLPHRGMEDSDDEFVKWWEQKHGKQMDMVDWIEAKIIEAVNKYNTRVIFIDHIHMIYSLEKMGNKSLSLEIGDMVGKIKKIALDYNLIVWLIAHCKDPADGRMREPRKEDIRDSGLISRLADTIIGVWRIKNEDDGTNPIRQTDFDEADKKAKIRVFKNRREGTQGQAIMYHNSHYLSEELQIDDFMNNKNYKDDLENF